MLFKKSKTTKELKGTSHFKFKIILYMLLCYFEIVSTVILLDSQTELISGMFLFKTVIRYHYTINNDYTRYNICSAWCLNIVISTCSQSKRITVNKKLKVSSQKGSPARLLMSAEMNNGCFIWWIKWKYWFLCRPNSFYNTIIYIKIATIVAYVFYLYYLKNATMVAYAGGFKG